MNITGDKTQFAIEWEMTATYEKDCYGIICFWIDGKCVGDLDYEVNLDVCLYHYAQCLRHKNIRTYRGSETLSRDELFYQLYERFFGNKANETGDYLNLGIYRAIFWVDEIGDASIRDKWNIILVDEPDVNRQRIIWRHLDAPEEKYEAFLPGNMFDEVANKFCEQVLQQWRGKQAV